MKLLSTAIVLCAFFLPNLIKAQVNGGKHQKLFDLYSLERYEDCAWKAWNMSETDKYRSDPEVYLYLSMSYLNIAWMDEEIREEVYKDPLKDALKYGGKFFHKDKSGLLVNPNATYLETLKFAGIDRSYEYLDIKKASKASSTMNYILKFAPKDAVVMFAKGFYDLKCMNSQGAVFINNAIPLLLDDKRNGIVYPEKEEDLLHDVLTGYSGYLESKEMQDSANAIMAFSEHVLSDYYADIREEEEKSTMHKAEHKNEVDVIYKKHISESSEAKKEDDLEVLGD